MGSMKIPEGYETIPQRALRTGEKESTIRYRVRKGKLAHKTIKIPVTVVPKDATSIK